MSEYTVVVRARRWQGPPQALSRALSPIINVSAEAAEAMLSRGPVTVEADLSEAEARALVQRLVAMGLPAEAMLEQELLTAMREDRAPAAPISASAPTPAPARAVSLFEESEADASGGWGDIFPELEPSQPAPRPALATPVPARSVTPVPQRAVERPQPPIVDLLGGDEVDALIGALDFGGEPVVKPAAPQHAPSRPPVPAARAAEPSFGAEPIGAPPRAVEPLWPAEEPVEAAVRPPARQASATPRAAAQPVEPPVEPPRRLTGGFDGGRIAEAIAAREDAPPYAPQGFDDSAPHLPWLAALLSALAPGAGQIYNGQAGRAMDHGLWFFMIKPWIEGVRQAKRQATRIATYWAPRPAPGSLFAAIKYALGWYMVVGVAVGIVSFLGVKVYERATREEIVITSEADIARAFEDARQDAQAARIKGLDAAMASAVSKRGPPIADERERAERLYLIGLQYCRATQLELCEATMRRVTQLQPSHRDAFRLQAWASLRIKGGEPKPMPPVASKETLSEYELRQISADMELPMPAPVPAPPSAPKPEPAPEAGPDEAPPP